MSIFDIFTKNTQPVQQQQSPQQQQQQAPTQPGNLPATGGDQQTAQTSGTAPNGSVPNTPVVTDGAKSGLDVFKEIWNNDPNQQQQGQPLFNVSQEKMMEAARKQSFTTGITPELMAKVTAGGADAAAAMMEMLNTVSQNAYAQSAFATTKLIEGALDKSGFAKNSDLDTRFKSMTVENNLRAENPMFSHPAVKPMIEGLKSQLVTKFPNATPQELTTMAQDYVSSFAAMAQAPQQQQQQQQANAAKGDFDWSKFV